MGNGRLLRGRAKLPRPEEPRAPPPPEVLLAQAEAARFRVVSAASCASWATTWNTRGFRRQVADEKGSYF